MFTRNVCKSVLLSCAALLAVLSVTDRSFARPRGEPEPTDPPPTKEDPIRPPRPLPTCAAPTLAECQDPGYLTSTCGKENRTTCGDMLLPTYQSAVRAVSATTPILKGDPGAETLALAKKLDPVSMPTAKATIGTFSFATTSQLERTKPAYADTANMDPQHPTFEANGAAVASCQEYAYESLYDHERFVEAAETCGTNAECVYQLSLRTSTPGLRTTMLKKNGQPMAWQTVRPASYSAIKNAFFARGEAALTVGASYLTAHPQYAASAAFRAKADAIIAHVNGTPKVTAASELAWHRSMHDAFAANPVSASELAATRQRTAAYGDALASAGAAKFAIGMLEAVIPGQSGDQRAQSEALLVQYRAQNTKALEDMARLLFEEWDRVSPTTGQVDHGCLNRSSVKCDWSPQKFVSRYARHNRQESERLFSACITATAGNFSRVPAASLADTDALATWIAAQELPKLGTEIVGERMNDGDEWGDRSWFAAGYSYDAGWQLAAERQSGTNRICKLKGNAYAQANANAWALGQQLSIFDSRHKLSVRESGDTISFHSHLRILGEDVYSPVDYSATAPSYTPLDKSTTKTLAQRTYTKWITIAAVPVKLQAKAEIKAGAEIKAKAVAASGCNPDNLAYDASITARPWVDFHVVPEASAGIGLIQAGARGDIQLIELSAPASGGVKLVGGVNDITLQMRANASVDVDMLSGDLDIFLESCIPLVGCTDLASKQIYAWDGYGWSFPLFNYSKDLKLTVFDAATKPSPMPIWSTAVFTKL